LQPFRYEAPTTLDEALALLAGANGEVRILAGGTDLIVQMQSGVQRPQLLVDLKRIPETRRIQLGSDGLRLGAAVSAAEVREHPELRKAYPGLVEAIELIGSEQIQGRATVGGNLCNASPAADSVPALVVVGAHCAIVGPAGERTLPVEEFVLAPAKTALQSGELLVELRVPAPLPRSADAYLRLIPRSEMDIAVVGAGVRVALDDDGRCSDARVALGAVGPTVLLVPEAAQALVGSTLDAAALEQAARAASSAAQPIDDKRGTAAYRSRIAGVLTRRAAHIAAERARSKS
jgi:carbon-monoxide dehydrogenase medium subunit